MLLNSVPGTRGPQGTSFCLACKGGHAEKGRDTQVFIQRGFKRQHTEGLILPRQSSEAQSETLSSVHTSLMSLFGGSPET